MIETEPTQRVVNSSFSQKLPTLQLAWDSTSLGELKLCPTRYKYTIIDGYVPRSTNVHLRFGIEFGSAIEVLDRAKVAGAKHEEATAEAVRYALTATWDTAAGRPWASGDDTKNRETLIQSIVDYADNFRDDPLEVIKLADGSAAVEQSFRFAVPDMEPSSTHETFEFCGYLDQAVRWQGRTRIKDIKTTGHVLNKAYFARYSPDNQMSLYALAGRIIWPDEDINGVIIDAVRITKTKPDFRRHPVERSEPQLTEWIRAARFWIGTAEVHAIENFWPQQDKACGAVYLDSTTGEISYGCPFRPVCGSDPSIRDELLRLNYTRRTWDPLKIREAKSNPTKLKETLDL